MFRLKIEEVQRFMAVFKGKKFLKHGYVTIVEKLKDVVELQQNLKTLQFDVWHLISYHMGLGQWLGQFLRISFKYSYKTI